MKKFLKIIGVILLIVVLFVLIAGLFVDKKFHFERDIMVSAPRERVWYLVSNLKSHEAWSPWKEKDPNMTVKFEGQDGTVGSKSSWKGNKDVGSGEQTITKLEQPSRVETDLHFIEPFDSHAAAFINLGEAGGGTKVTWGFDSEMPYPMNVMQLFMNMDETMNDEFTKGLTKLKRLCEAN